MVRAFLLVVIVSMGMASSAFAAQGHRIPPARPVVGVVNVNTATPKQLAMLPGVGKKRAKEIVAYREKQHFAKPQDLRKVKGVGAGVWQKIETHVTVAGPTTIQHRP